MEPSPQLPDRSIETRGALPTTVVVVGVDDSESSWDAFWWSCGETKRRGARIVAVLVSPSAGSGMVAAGAAISATCAVDFSWIDHAATELAEQLRQKLASTANEAAVDFAFVHARGDAPTELLRIATAQRADLIVVGKSTKVRHRIAGSLGRQLIGKRNVPVVVVVP
jgi:nucleotide-binding universal stress UspA family protein